MSDSPQLEAFLDDQADDGQSLGEAEFKVDRDEALRKLAQHSLPFEGAWLLKAVQTAVASGCRLGIFVKSTRTETEIRFDTCRPWSVDEVQQAFLDPAPCADEVLGHLKYALWGAGVSSKHPFELHLPGATEALLWPGHGELSRLALESPTPALMLRVPHDTAGESPGFLARRRRARKINAETTGALSNNAYTCPVPLHLDGRRLDSLFLAPAYFGWEVAQPIEIGFLQAQGCPEWRLPLGTFDAFRKRPYTYKPAVIDKMVVEAIDEAPQIGTCSIAYLYVAHIGQRTIGKSVSWYNGSSKSSLIWVKDGVLVRTETFPMEATALSMSCYVSAEGLAMDLTTLQLIASDTKAVRTADAIRAMSYDLAKSRDFSFADLVAGSRRDDRVAGGFAMVFGVVTLVAVPVGLLLLWAAHKSFKEAGNTVERLTDEVVAGYPLLQARWREAHADYLPPAEAAEKGAE